MYWHTPERKCHMLYHYYYIAQTAFKGILNLIYHAKGGTVSFVEGHQQSGQALHTASLEEGSQEPARVQGWFRVLLKRLKCQAKELIL